MMKILENTKINEFISNKTFIYTAYITLACLFTAELNVVHTRFLLGAELNTISFLTPLFAGILFGYLLARIKLLGDQLKELAFTDTLTGIYNRLHFNRLLDSEIERTKRYGGELSVIFFDIDHFKRVNDEFGHLVGDQILTDFARRVKTELRGMDTVNPTNHASSFGRYGGEEFIAVLPDTDLLGARHCADRIRQLIAEHSFRDNCTITVSAGVAEYKIGETVPQMLTRADQALYQAKRDGRNRVRCSERRIKQTDPTIPKLRILK